MRSSIDKMCWNPGFSLWKSDKLDSADFKNTLPYKKSSKGLDPNSLYSGMQSCSCLSLASILPQSGPYIFDSYFYSFTFSQGEGICLVNYNVWREVEVVFSERIVRNACFCLWYLCALPTLSKGRGASQPSRYLPYKDSPAAGTHTVTWVV